MRKLLVSAGFCGIAAAVVVFLVLAAMISGCAGAAPTAKPLGEPAARIAAPASSDTLLCIGSNLNHVQVLGWLATHGYLEGEPWTKIFFEPPMTGPRPGVDSTRYVDFFRGMCERTVSAWDSAGCRFLPFADWPADSQAAFLAREWRCGLFNQCDPEPCVCAGTRWAFETEGG